MTRFRFVSLLALLTLGTAQAQVPPYDAFPWFRPSLAPGSTFNPVLSTPAGERATLNTGGRHLVWVTTAAFATPQTARARGNMALRLHETLRPLGRISVIYVPTNNLDLPPRSARAGLEALYPGAALYFDERETVRRANAQSVGGRNELVDGLYLMNGAQVVCRFIGSDLPAWELRGIAGPIVRIVTEFMRSGRVTFCPEPLQVPGARISDGALPGAGRVRLLFTFRADMADVPPQLGRGPVPADRQSAAFARFHAEHLEALARQAGAVPVAFTTGLSEAERARLVRAFPGWTFLPDTPESGARWLELAQAAVVGPAGEVRLSFLGAFGGDFANTSALLRALRP